MRSLLMYNYGEQCSNHTYVLQKNEPMYMYYCDFNGKYTIEANSKIKNGMKCFETMVRDSSLKEKQTSQRDILSIDDANMYHFFPIGDLKFKGADAEKNEELFTVSVNYKDNKSAELSFGKDKIVVFSNDRCCTIFKNNNGNINFTEPLETYQFTDTGFFCVNKEFKQYTACFNYNRLVDYKLPIKINTRTNCILLDRRPTSIEYFDETNPIHYNLGYDEFGLIHECYKNNEKINHYRYEYNFSNDSKEIYSLHPLLLDPFNYEYIDEPDTYWALDHLHSYGNIINLDRDVYKIYPDLLEELLSRINSDFAHCILLEN